MSLHMAVIFSDVFTAWLSLQEMIYKELHRLVILKQRLYILKGLSIVENEHAQWC